MRKNLLSISLVLLICSVSSLSAAQNQPVDAAWFARPPSVAAAAMAPQSFAQSLASQNVFQGNRGFAGPDQAVSSQVTQLLQSMTLLVQALTGALQNVVFVSADGAAKSGAYGAVVPLPPLTGSRPSSTGSTGSTGSRVSSLPLMPGAQINGPQAIREGWMKISAPGRVPGFILVKNDIDALAIANDNVAFTNAFTVLPLNGPYSPPLAAEVVQQAMRNGWKQIP